MSHRTDPSAGLAPPDRRTGVAPLPGSPSGAIWRRSRPAELRKLGDRTAPPERLVDMGESMRRAEPIGGHGSFDDDDLLSAGMAAAIAGRSIRTIRRAYAGGGLIAYRDGGGRGVRIRYGDLRDWLLREPAVATSPPVPAAERPTGRLDERRRDARPAESQNLALLNAARRRRRKRREPGAGAGRRAAGRRASSEA